MRPALIAILFLAAMQDPKEKPMTLKKQLKGVHQSIFVSDLKKSAEFYSTLIGAEPSYSLEKEVGYVLIPGYSLNLCEDAARAGKEERPRLTLAVNKIDALYDSLKEKGVKFRGAPKQGDHARTCVLEDPDGNLIELAE
jgi:catechol 2,3-dioxygenase-like lactoylglutathione lyase family enzyme